MTYVGTPTKQGSNRMSPTLGSSSSDSFSDRQFIAITSEKTARVIALPSQNCVYRQQIADTDYVVKAEIISLKGTYYVHSFIFRCLRIIKTVCENVRLTGFHQANTFYSNVLFA